jgi:hypothetical protein
LTHSNERLRYSLAYRDGKSIGEPVNCSATPISVAWEVQGTSAAPANIDAQSTSNGNIWKTSNTSATPVMIACYTSRLEISAGRQILTYT